MITDFETFSNDPNTWEPVQPRFEFMTRIYVKLEGERLDFGKVSPYGARRIIPITGGKVEGPMLNGEVLNQGADYQIGEDDGTVHINARYVLKSSDGALIYIHTQGIKVVSPEILAEQKIRPVHPSRFYFRQYIFFEASAPQYDWLNKTLAIGTIRGGAGAEYLLHDIYLVR